MALRATSGPTLSTRSLTVGQTLTVTAKIENTASADEAVTLVAEDTKDVALAFEPASLLVPGKGRKSAAFTWTAALPAGKEALTIRGKLVLRSAATGALVGSAPLDVYVRA